LVRNFDLRARIKSYPGGSELLESYQRNRVLIEKHRNEIVGIIADFYWENKTKTHGIEFQKLLAAKIVEVFPKESVVSRITLLKTISNRFQLLNN
jgi:hypothetical protein